MFGVEKVAWPYGQRATDTIDGNGCERRADTTPRYVEFSLRYGPGI